MGSATPTTGDLVSQVSFIADNFYSGVRTRTAIESPFLYQKKPKITSVPEDLKMDFTRILNKPFFVKNINWQPANPVHSVLGKVGIPSEILTNALAKIPFQSSSFFRAKVALILQVSGTPMHQGMILAAAVPRLGTTADNEALNINKRLAAPHVFLSANEATPVILEVPFYSLTKLRNVDLLNTTVGPEPPTLDYAQVEFQIMSPLAVNSGGSSEVAISVHAMFVDMDFYVPHTDPAWVAQGFISDIRSFATRSIDGTFGLLKQVSGDLLDTLRQAASNGLTTAREAIRAYTGLHAPEIPTLEGRLAVQNRQNVNLVDAPSYFEKLDPFSQYTRIVDDYFFDTDIDEMDMRFILSKPQFIGSFKVSFNTAPETLLWSRPITPVQLVYESPPNNYTGTGNATFSNWSSSLLQNFSYMSKFWKGSLKLHIQMCASSVSFAKLAIVRNYSPDSRMLTNAPAYNDVQNLLTEHIEFSSGGQVQTIDLPYCSTMNQLPCTTDWEMNALQHGMYYIYLPQKLIINATVPNDVRFNVYISAGEDFTFMGYATRPVEMAYPFVSSNSIRREERENEFKAEATSSFPVNSQDDLLNKREERIKPDLDVDFRPIVSVRDYIRRFHKVYAQKITYDELNSNGGLIKINISGLSGNLYTPQPSDLGFPGFNASIFGMPSSPLAFINNMFYGYTGGYKFKVNILGVEYSELWYIPPDYAYNDTNKRWLYTNPINSGAITTTIDESLLESFKFPTNGPVLLSRFNPRLSNPTVEIDRPNYHIGSMNSRMGETDLLATTHQFEGEIPNMTPFRFIANNIKGCHFADYQMANAGADVGSLLIRLSPNISIPPADLKTSVAVEVYLAATDEGRHGYQVFSPILSIPTAPGPDGSNNNYQVIPSLNINTARPPYVIPRAFVSGAYKGNYTVT